MGIPGNANLLLLTEAAGAAPTGYEITRSLRFNSADSARLSRNFNSTGNQKTCTFSAWVKRSKLGTVQFLFEARDATSDSPFQFDAGDTATIGFSDGVYVLTTSQVFRDVSAWYHIVIAFDTTQSTASDRVKLYVNGSQITQFSGTYPPQDHVFAAWNKTGVTHYISNYTYAGPRLFMDCMLADVHFIDGQALAATDFGEFDDNNVWQPIAYAGTYGTNGFHLDFSDATSTTTIAEDSSGNNNDWTANNISVSAGAGNDSLFDSPTNANAASDTGAGGEVSGNYCTLNPLKKGSGLTLSNGNLDGSIPAGPPYSSLGTIGMSSGKWYAEYTYVGGSYSTVGIAKDSATIDSYPGYDANGWSYDSYAGKKIHNNTQSTYGATFTTNDVIGIAFDADNGTLTFYKNNTSQGQAFSGLTSGPYFFASGVDNSQFSWNFGQRAFAYTAPTGYQPLTTALLDDPTIADGSTAMDVALYTGTGSSQSISGFNFSPNLVWAKGRNSTTSHDIYDIVRGVNKRLRSNGTDAEATRTNALNSFDSDGFTVGADPTGNINQSGVTMAAWMWDGGSSTVSNTDGSITSSVRANASAGFSIVGYTGNATTGATIGHGLGAIPKLVIIKDRTNGTDWEVWHGSLSNTSDGLILNGTDAATSRNRFDVTGFTSTVFKIGSTLNNVNYSSSFNYVAYCFAPVSQYSAFGSYTGNGSSDGPFVYTGFRPRWIMIKCSSSNQGGNAHWAMYDTARLTRNPGNSILFANLSSNQLSTYSIDILSNGFKVRDTDAEININNDTYVWAAFASHPFKTSRAR